MTDGTRHYYLDVVTSLKLNSLQYFHESRTLNPGVIEELLFGGAVLRDPGELSERVWQLIWHATKEEPKACPLTFVEIFMLKFLSDNLDASILPKKDSFYELLRDPQDFVNNHGCSPIEHYINSIRPRIKSIFPDNTVLSTPNAIDALFGLTTVISKTSVINGFAFMKLSGSSTPAGYNRVFIEILKAFADFGPLSSINPEFKMRLYETFLKKSARNQKLGQFFTPRNVVQQIVKMACVAELQPGAVILDPACGVGGFVLEPPLIEPSLSENLTFQNGVPLRKIKLVGVDVDPNAHILAKANLLLHNVEAVRSPTTTMAALNQLMAETFLLMNTNETLGALEYPPQSSLDLIMTNPPFVT